MNEPAVIPKFQPPTVRLMWDARQLANAIWPERPATATLDDIIQRAEVQRLVWETQHLHDIFQ